MLVPYNPGDRRLIARRYARSVGLPAAAGAAIPYAGGMARNLYSRYQKYMYGNAARSAAAQARRMYKNRRKSKKVKREYKKQVKRNRPINRLKRDVKSLKRLSEADMGTLVFRERYSSSLSSAINQQAVFETDATCSKTTIERALAQLKYYDPQNPTVLVTADGASGTYQKEFMFKRSYAKIKLINNYQSPCDLTVYTMKVREDTSISPNLAWTQGLTDGASATSTNALIYPSDSNQLTDLWKIHKTQKTFLQPGEAITVSTSSKVFTYDPSVTDSHNLDYQDNWGSTTFLVVIKGIPGHDSGGAAQIGLLRSGIDIMIDRVYEIKYPAGADIKYTYVVDNAATAFTTGGVYSAKPYSDNIDYSVA